MDANTIYRLGDLANIPAESVEYERGDRVEVWTLLPGGGEGFAPATVLDYDKRADGAFRVLLDRGGELSYLSGAAPLPTHFCLALPLGQCANAERRRAWVHLYTVPPGAADAVHLGERAGWRGLLVGPGARPVGAMLASRLSLLPDADDSCMDAGGDGECYWLYTRAESAQLVRERIAAAATCALRAFAPLQRCLEESQCLWLQGGSPATLQGPGALALAGGLARALPQAAVRALSAPQKRCVRRERITVEGAGGEELLAALQAAMRAAGLPARLLREGTPPEEWEAVAGAGERAWRCGAEGPNARYAGRLEHEGWRSPANTLSVCGPHAEALCLVNYARARGEAPAVAHVEEVLPAALQHGPLATPAHAAAARWALGGLKERQAHGLYYGPWALRPAADEQEREDQAAVLPQWSARNVRRLLQGQLLSAPPTRRLEVAVRLEEAPPAVEWEDFRRADGTPVFAATGWAQLENPGQAPEGWVTTPGAECRLRLTVRCEPGAAFPQARARELPRVRVCQRRLARAEGDAEVRRRLQAVFRTGEEHVGLENWRGDVVREPEPLPLCASGHPQPWDRLARPERFDLADLEDWAAHISSGRLPCSFCGACSAALGAAVPGLWTMLPREDVLVCVFPGHWQPAPLALKAEPAPLPALEAPVQAPALGVGPCSEAERAAALASWGLGAAPPFLAEELLRTVPSAALPWCEALAREVAARPPEKEAATRELAREVGHVLSAARSQFAVETVRQVFAAEAEKQEKQSPAATPRGRELTRALRQLRTAPAGRSWELRPLLLLAVAANGHAEAAGLSAFLRLLLRPAEPARTAEARAVQTWLAGAPDEPPPPLARLTELLGQRRPQGALRESFGEALRDCAGVPGAEGAPRGLAFAMRAVCAAAATSTVLLGVRGDMSTWNAASITEWVRLSASWSPDESVGRLRIAVARRQSAARVLRTLAENSVSAAQFDIELQTLCGARAAAPPPTAPAGRRPLAQRLAEQLVAPAPGTERWEDAHDQWEHQALLLDHVLRELMSALFRLSALAPPLAPEVLEDLELATEDAVAAVLRGDPEHLAAEQLVLDTRLDAAARERACAGLEVAEGAQLLDVLTCGAASLTGVTGRCLPRRRLWELA